VIAAFRPEVLVSAGFAGSLDARLRAPMLFLPARVLDARTGTEFETEACGETETRQTLLTVDAIAGAVSKPELAQLYGAEAVDMEAAGVAQAARAHGVAFRVVKAISEDYDFPMPAIQPFVDDAGDLHTARFLAYVALRPELWGPVWRLKGNTQQAASALAEALAGAGDGAGRIVRQPGGLG
jgi:nucleoside phosphorylase